MNILQQICARKRIEVEQQKQEMPFEYLKDYLNLTAHQTISFKSALCNSQTGIIAEFKRKSPSKGWINLDAVAKTVVKAYAEAGAAAVSILTDAEFFGGRFFDFKKARKVVDYIPFLRKDFIVDEYQIYQSKVLGADVILLIAACLTQDEVKRFTTIAHQLDLEVLLEIHNESELAYIQSDIDVVGINNRDLKTFQTDIQRTIDLANHIPSEYVKISESGLSKPETVLQLRQCGFQGFLMGENFMKTDHPALALKQFISALQ
ncbi:MAG: indole-3-glycerol phosphate synthase TrpC [Candidatus Symbiothrix sp.]|jgi:indole-3-glycerol phosphate synthase|nr:indole-3-glycerol phosphate synthase TrpC [Candidatus Symbiothrix sp.]